MDISEISNIGTTIGVLIAAWQLALTRKQNVINFEDIFAREYRELIAKVPTKAMLGEELDELEIEKYLDEFYHYFDLCNEQIFLHNNGRISNTTWEYWKEGIISNFRRPAFSHAWSYIASRADSDFSELRSLCPPNP